MRHKPAIFTILALIAIVVLIVLTSKQKPQTANAAAAIEHAQTMGEPGDKLQFLLKEARLFLDNKQPQETIKTCKYIKLKILEDCDEADDLMTLANRELK